MDFKEKIVLENERARLEPLMPEHLEKLQHIADEEPMLLQYSPSPFGGEGQLQEFFSMAYEERAKKSRYAFAIFDKKQDRYVGSTSYGNISLKNQRVEIGWTWIDKASQGTGLNKYCKHLLLVYAFENLMMKRVELKTDDRNIQSKKAIEKLGAKYEGTLRSHALMLDGFRRDTVYYSILENEWPGIKKSIFSEF